MGTCNYTSEAGGASGSEYGKEFASDEDLVRVGLFRCYPETLLQFASACCVIFMLIGIPGNLTTIVALARCKKVRNATAIFIINLHTSDLIFNCFILPMTAMTFTNRHWTYGWVMCRVYAYFKFVLNSSSIFTVVAISINRYVIVCHPLLYPKLYKRRNIYINILIIWASALAIFLAPIFGAWGRFDLEPNGGFCTMMPEKSGYSPKKTLLIAAFAGPVVIIALCYARIWWVVQTAKKIQSENHRPTRPTHLPLSQTQSDLSTVGINLASCDPSSPVSSTAESMLPEGDKTSSSSDTSAPQSPREDKAIAKYFKAPFRLTKKLIRRKMPTRRDKRLCAMIAAIMISFCVGHLPVLATRLLYKEYKSEPIVNVFAHLLEYSSKCMNPIIYVLMSKEYRQAYQSLFEAVKYKFQTLLLRSSQVSDYFR